MSNKRIDLAQFEGHTEWLPARTYNEQLLVQMKYAEALAEIARQREEDPHEMNHADDALVVNATALIAELKRSYERMDYHKCLLDELYSSERISPSDILAIEREVKREFYPELFHHGDGWEISGGPCECIKCVEY